MAVLFLDTNLIIRYMTRDDPGKAERVRRIFQQVEAGSLTVTASESVINEAVFVLSSKALYHLPREQIRTDLTILLSLKGLQLPHKRTYLRALDLYSSTNIDFMDCVSVAHMERQKISAILSFDEDFDGIEGITRQEP